MSGDLSLRFLLLASALSLAACGQVPPLAIQGPDLGWPGVAVSPMRSQRVFLGSFRDVRAVRDRVGTARGALSMARGPLVLQRDPVEVVRQAVEAGISARGHTVVANATDANVVVVGEVKEFWVDTYFQPIGAERVARVEARVFTHPRGADTTAGTRTLRSEAKVYAGNQIAMEPVVQAIEAALRELARSAATDDALETAIQRAAETAR